VLEPGTARFERRERSGRWGMDGEGAKVMLRRLPSRMPGWPLPDARLGG
jgi:hypothetical protein